MKVKTSVTLPGDLVKAIGRHDRNRSAFIEKAIRAYIARLEKVRADARDVEIINRNADDLNREAADVLEYQRLR